MLVRELWKRRHRVAKPAAVPVRAALEGWRSGKCAPCLSTHPPDALREASAELDGGGGHTHTLCVASGGTYF